MARAQIIQRVSLQISGAKGLSSCVFAADEVRAGRLRASSPNSHRENFRKF
jgi:hypothetical protein